MFLKLQTRYGPAFIDPLHVVSIERARTKRTPPRDLVPIEESRYHARLRAQYPVIVTTTLCNSHHVKGTVLAIKQRVEAARTASIRNVARAARPVPYEQWQPERKPRAKRAGR